MIITQNNFEKNVEMKVYPRCENKRMPSFI